MEGDLRAALLVLILISAPLAGSMGAGAEFKCFQTPGEGIRCACIGASDCSEMKSSGSCSGGYRVAIFCYAVTLCGIKRRYSMELIGGVVVEDPLGQAAEGPAAAACTDPPCSRHRQLHQARHQHVDDCCRSP